MIKAALVFVLITVLSTAAGAQQPQSVNVHNFARAETDMYFSKMAAAGSFGKIAHRREPASIDKQDVVRMNRDTLYSEGLFDLQAGPVTITLPDSGKRFMSLQVISEDHYTPEVVYGPGRFTYTAEKVGTRYGLLLVRTLVDPEDPKDIAAVHQLQDAIKTEQANPGTFAVPRWDAASQTQARNALAVLGALGGTSERFGRREEVDPVDFLIGTAIGWGGNPRYAADYLSAHPAKNDGKTTYRLTVKDVPVDGFWSVSVYDANGYFQKNDRNAYSLNNLTAKANPDGSTTIAFGGCERGAQNCLPIMAGWNYTVRLYRPRKEILDGSWKFPDAQPIE